MLLKSTERFQLVFEVDLDNMTVILKRDRKNSKPYEVEQYFQDFVSYGVRKADKVQLKEHFCISYFQNILITGKAVEGFEFCVKFEEEGYKILECKFEIMESPSRNILKISLNDISHKRVQQLSYIQKESQGKNAKVSLKFFNIPFEQESEKEEKKKKKIKSS